jgi:hypothetical protein
MFICSKIFCFLDRYWKGIILLVFFFASIGISAQVGIQLDIPGRLQWDNANGYCGETSIQMIGLYYGNYISQDVCRTVGGGEVLIHEGHWEEVLNSFSFTFEDWDNDQPEPQYQNFLVWIKQHLYDNNPVIIGVFVQELEDPDYDHIFPVIGFSGTNTNEFNNADELKFNDCYEPDYFTRSFQSIWDSRSMSGNGAIYEYCIPKQIDFGSAITGIKDEKNETKPVHLSVDRWDEPNVTLGEPPVLLNANITVESLTPGEDYALLRYNNYALVPSSDFDPDGASSTVYFTASGSSQSFSDSFMSNAAIFYRCIPYNSTGNFNIEKNENKLFFSPNPANKIIHFEEIGNYKIYSIEGYLAQVLNTQFADISTLPQGLYFIKNSSGYSEKLIIQY